MDKIICVGKNYLEHAKEMGDGVPEQPILFLKPPSILRTVAHSGAQVMLPKDRGAVHYETEIVIKLGNDLKIDAVTMGFDMTLREVQGQLKKAGHPWEVAKVFPSSAIVGPFIPFSKFRDFMSAEFTMKLDGKLKQRGRGEEMIHKPNFLLSFIPSRFPLCPGDLLFTGTPAGVGPIENEKKVDVEWGALRYSFDIG